MADSGQHPGTRRAPARAEAEFLPYEQMFACMFDGVLVAEPGGRVVMANDAAARIFGVPRSELLVPIREYAERFGLRETSGPHPVPIALRALQGEVVAPLERVVRTPDGTEKTVRTSAAPIRDEGGAITGAVVLVADVTAAKEEVDRARERAATLHAAYGPDRHAAELLELGDAFFELDREWRIIRVNTRQEMLLRKPRAETLGRTFAELWPELAGPGPGASREYRRCMDDRVPVQFQEYWASLAMWTGVTAYPVGGGGIAVFFRDVTELKRAEDALRESEATARAISENIRDALVVLRAVRDPARDVADWRCIDANEGALTLLGITRENVIGRSLREVMPARSPAFLERLVRVLATGERNTFETEYRGEAFLITVFRVDAETVGSAAIDITDRKRAEARAAFLARFPEENPDPILRLAPDRTVLYANPAAMSAFGGCGLSPGVTGPPPLADAALVALREGRRIDLEISCGEAVYAASVVPVGSEVNVYAHDITTRKIAEEAVRDADRRKTEFLGILSHELRNPLAPIRNGIFLLEKLSSDSPQAARARQAIRRQTDHLTRLIDDLLDVTRISRGKIQLHREVMDLRNLVRRTCEDHRLLFEENDIDLRLDFPAAAVWVDIDATRITQVVGNLLQNASKFTPPQGTVTVALRSLGGSAAIRVADTGIGIEPGRVALMFEAFAQEDRGLARTRGGLGLGLALAKGLVELHGGAIAALSDGPGKGAEFTITLPLAAQRPQAAAPAVGLRSTGSRRRVLVIEDNVDSARTLADVLEVHGHEVTVARDGTTGIALARELKPEVVICDIGLPDVDGYEVARTLRLEASLQATKLIALSGYAQPEDRERAREAGFEAHLPKPAPLDELAALVTDSSRRQPPD